MKKIIPLLMLITFISGFSYAANAMTPDEYCTLHTDSGAPGSCEANGNCAVITTNLGTEECKLCQEGGCELAECSECE